MHIITGLEVGGAEITLSRLLGALPSQEFSSSVISLLPGGVVAGWIRDLGVPVRSVEMFRGIPTPAAAWRLRRLVRTLQPAVVQGWMYHGNLAAWYARWGLDRAVPVAWNIRQTLYELRRERPGTRLVIAAGARLSPGISAVVYNSELARRQHEAYGFRPPLARVISNGFDCERFRPAPDARAALRAELGIPANRLVVGMVSRWHPMKGHETFFAAARLVLDRGLDVAFVCAGRGVTAANPRVSAALERQGLGGRVYLLGERSDTPRLYAGFDVSCCSSSWGEGFPNAVGEAMACGTPCVVTDVGEARALVGDAGRVVPPGDPAALGAAVGTLLAAGTEARHRLGAAGRARILREFSLQRMAEAYADFYRHLAGLVGKSIERAD
ncbi:MAG TPA: glycosyltransferase [Gemmatimonadales bacterium]|nr:glycosyltransferase [Gemmatimonadales bacterium]